MAKATKISPFRLTSLVRLEKNPTLALHLFRNPNPNLPQPPKYTAKSYDLIISKLGRARRFTEMEQILDQMAQETRFAPKESLLCHVITLYGRAHMGAAALRTFHRLPAFRCRRSIRSFNSLLAALLNCRQLSKITDLFRDLDEFHPDACTYNILIRASGSLDRAFQLFDEMHQRGIEPNVITFGTLISSLCFNSKIDEAFRLKDEMMVSYNVKPNAHIYTSLIKAVCVNGEVDRAIGLKDEIAEPDSAVYTTVISALFREGRKGEVVGVLEEMKRNGVRPDVVTYNAMVAGFCEDLDFEAAFEVLNEMERVGIRADVVSYNTIISGFCNGGRVEDAVELFEDMPRRGCRPDVVCYRMVFEGLCGVGRWRDASLVYDEMVFRGFEAGEGGLRKFLEGLCESEEWSTVVGVLCRLSKGRSGRGLEGWKMAVSRVLEASRLFESGKFIDHLCHVG